MTEDEPELRLQLTVLCASLEQLLAATGTRTRV